MRLTSFCMVLATGLLTAAHAEPLDVDMQRAHAAFDAGLAHKGRGDLDTARQFFTTALAHAADGSSIAEGARDELDYFLPLMRVQRLLWRGQTAAAERALGDLARRFADDPQRHTTISNIMAEVGSSQARAVTAPRAVDERAIARTARSNLARYHRIHQGFPARRDLGEVIGLSKPAMAMFEVARYVTSDRGYLLVLRNKNDQSHTLTLEHTGLLE